MTMPNPFSHVAPNCPVEKCSCCENTLLVADTPVFEEEPAPATLTLPTEALIFGAMQVVRAMREQATPPTVEQRLIAGLLDAYVLHAELLTRCVIHGRFETGDADFDAEQLEVALDIAQDVCRAGLRTADAPPEVPDSIRLDIGNWATDVGLDAENDDEDDEDDARHDAKATVVCDIPGCHAHPPTPTIFEA
jgi:hypothetical protein